MLLVATAGTAIKPLIATAARYAAAEATAAVAAAARRLALSIASRRRPFFGPVALRRPTGHRGDGLWGASPFRGGLATAHTHRCAQRLLTMLLSPPLCVAAAAAVAAAGDAGPCPCGTDRNHRGSSPPWWRPAAFAAAAACEAPFSRAAAPRNSRYRRCRYQQYCR